MGAGKSLKDKTIAGVGWSVVEQVGFRAVNFAVGIVLARLLSPDDYGLIGLAYVVLDVLLYLADSSLGDALVRKKDVSQADCNTMFWFNIGVGAFMFALLWVVSPFLASYLERPELSPLTRAMGLSLIISAFGKIQSTLLIKRINFKLIAKMTLITSVLGGVLGVALALNGFGVWSLVFQTLFSATLRAALLWVWGRWRPRLEFSAESFRELFGFSWKLLASGLLDKIWGNIYQLVIGKCYKPEVLGYYSRAHNYAAFFSSNLVGVVQRVTYPVLSEMQGDSARLRDGYRRIIRVVMLVDFCGILMLAAVGRALVEVLIGERWLPCVPFLQIICFSMMLYPLHSINLNMLKVQGRSDLFLRLEIYKKLIGVIPILLGVYYDIYAMVWASVVAGFVAYYLNAYYSGKFLDYGIWAQVKDVLPSFGVAALGAGVAYGLSFLPLPAWAVLVAQAFAGCLVLLVVCECAKLPEYREAKSIVLRRLKRT